MRNLRRRRQRLFNRLRLEGAKRVLDFGSGAGYFVEALRQSGFEASGVEISNYLIQKSIEFFGVTPAPALDDAQGQLDVVFMDNVIEHLDGEILRHVLAGIWRKLNDGGTSHWLDS